MPKLIKSSVYLSGFLVNKIKIIIIMNKINMLFLGITTIIIAIFILSACRYVSVKSKHKNSDSFIKTVNTKTFKKFIEIGDGILIDVRTPEEFAAGHIAGAQIINVNDSTFKEKINLLPKEKEIFVYCRSGKRSLTAAEILQKNGFDRIYNLDKGILGWEGKGYDIKTE
jgi:rhodanese-related sulfurtransferase